MGRPRHGRKWTSRRSRPNTAAPVLAKGVPKGGTVVVSARLMAADRPHRRAARFLGYPGPAAGALSRRARDSSGRRRHQQCSPAPENFFCKTAFTERLTPSGDRNRFWTGFCERGHKQFSESKSPPYRGASDGQRHRRAGKQLDELSPSHARPSLWAARFPLRPHLPCQTASAQAFAVRSSINPSCMQLSHRP
jgi:hypothetical protein